MPPLDQSTVSRRPHLVRGTVVALVWAAGAATQVVAGAVHAQSPASAAPAGLAPAAPPGLQEKIDGLIGREAEQRIQTARYQIGLESLQKYVSDLKDTFTTVFGLCFGAIGLVFSVATIIQTIGSRREFALVKEQMKRYEDIVAKQDEVGKQLQTANQRSIDEATKFVGLLSKVFDTTRSQDAFAKELQKTSRDSIEQVTKFIGSLDSLFQLTHKAADLEANIKAMKDREEIREKTEAQNRRLEARELNRQALDICFTLDRENYKAGYHQQRIRSLSEKLAALPHKDLLSSNSRRILGLDYVVRGMFKEALGELDMAVGISRDHATDRSTVDLDLFYPAMDPSNVQSSATREANISLFHRAIACYNLGDHIAAIAQFRDAVRYRGSDVQALAYIPESRFLSRQFDFPEIIKAFEDAETEIKGIPDTTGWRVPREGHLSLLRVKRGNCYFPGCRHEPYRKFENLREAEENYLAALKYDQELEKKDPTRPPAYLAKFSYGHALTLKAKRSLPEAERRAASELGTKLLGDVLDAVKVKVGEVTEPKIQMTLYYMLAICNNASGNAADAKRNILDIYERGGKLPPIEGFRIFSPLTKNDLTYPEFKRELRDFETRL